MAINRNSKKEEQTTEAFEVEVTRALECKNGSIAFDMKVNGVAIYGCFYRTVTKKDGSTFDTVSFPQRKGTDKDGKDAYYNYAYFKITDEIMKTIEKGIEAVLK